MSEITAEQRAWAKKLDKLLKAMPKGIEILVGDGHIHVHPEGFYMREVWTAGIDMMTASNVLDDGCIHFIPVDRNRVRANSETI